MKKRPPNLGRPFLETIQPGLASNSCRNVRIRLFCLDLLPVALNEVKLLSMTVASVEVILLHLSVDLVIVPVVVIETVYRGHHASAVPSPSAVHVKLAGGRIVSNRQKLAYLLRAWIPLINDGDINVAHSSRLNGRLLALTGIVCQIDNGLYSQCGKLLKLFRFGAGAAVKLLIHLAKIVDLNIGKIALLGLGKREGRKREDKRDRSDRGWGKPSKKRHLKSPQLVRHKLITVGLLGNFDRTNCQQIT